MTALAQRKSKLQIVTSDTVREHGKLREVTLEANPYFATVRLKGLRTSYPISWAAIYDHAVKIAVEKARAEREARKLRRS